MFNDIQNNLYSILEINETATQEEIKKSYKRLACIYHPDKSKDPMSSEKFIKIKTAYDILANSETRYKYNMINDKQELFDLIIITLQQYSESAPIYLKKILTSIYKNDEYISDLNTFRFDKVFEKIFTNPMGPIDTIKHNEKLDIIENVNCDLIDRYLDEYLYVKIKRQTKDEIYKYISLKNDINIFEGDGEFDEKNNTHGNLKVYVKIKNKNGYNFMEHNLLKKIPVKKSEYRIINNIKFRHIDNNIIVVKKEEFEFIDENTMYKIIKNKGLPIDSSNRGDLIVDIRLVN